MIPLASPRDAVDDETIKAVIEVIKSGSYINGERLKAFESDFSRFVGAKRSVGVSSGTAALHLAFPIPPGIPYVWQSIVQTNRPWCYHPVALTTV